VAEVETELGEVPRILGTPSELNQVFLHLLQNAAHAVEDVVRGTGQRGVIRVESRLEADAVVVSISDTGTGISEAARAQVFEPFFTTKPVGQGTGQGLAEARAVLARHHGEITFTTELGRGTTFTLRLPLP
jgi:signal transduction histidine kinase